MEKPTNAQLAAFLIENAEAENNLAGKVAETIGGVSGLSAAKLIFARVDKFRYAATLISALPDRAASAVSPAPTPSPATD